jgi:hypothetical protein
VLTQLPAEVLKPHTVLHAGQVEEHLINGILFHLGASSWQFITRDIEA